MGDRGKSFDAQNFSFRDLMPQLKMLKVSAVWDGGRGIEGSGSVKVVSCCLASSPH